MFRACELPEVWVFVCFDCLKHCLHYGHFSSSTVTNRKALTKNTGTKHVFPTNQGELEILDNMPLGWFLYTCTHQAKPKPRSCDPDPRNCLEKLLFNRLRHEFMNMVWWYDDQQVLVLIWDGNGLWWFLNMVTLLFPGPVIFFARVSMRANPMSFRSEPRPRFHTVMTICFWPTKIMVLLCYQQILEFIVHLVVSCSPSWLL